VIILGLIVTLIGVCGLVYIWIRPPKITKWYHPIGCLVIVIVGLVILVYA